MNLEACLNQRFAAHSTWMSSSKWLPHQGRIICRFISALLLMSSKMPACSETAQVTYCLASTSKDHHAITCMFPEDIHATQKSFCVYHFQENQTDTVVLCNWVDRKPACRTKEGFNTPENVTSLFTTKTSKKIHGQFGCDTLHSHTSVTRCQLLTSGGASRNETAASSGPGEAVTPYPGNRYNCSSLEGLKADGHPSLWLLSAALALLSLVILETILLIAGCYMLKKRRHKMAKNINQEQMKPLSKDDLAKEAEHSPSNKLLSSQANGFPPSPPVGACRAEGATSDMMSNQLATEHDDVKILVSN